eukprot:929484-Alexandrium_andersonii.AAC.1
MRTPCSGAQLVIAHLAGPLWQPPQVPSGPPAWRAGSRGSSSLGGFVARAAAPSCQAQCSRFRPS